MRFSQTWFEDGPKIFWDAVLPERDARSYLEVGSFEGASACWIIQHIPQIEQLVCIDTWDGSREHAESGVNMAEVEARFEDNITEAGQLIDRDVGVVKLKQKSKDALVHLLHEGYSESFDIIYIDGSHSAKDVLMDLILGFELLNYGGLMIIDDYLWMPSNSETQNKTFNPLETPKLAIDAFTTIYRDSLKFIDCSWSQVMFEKR